MDTHQPTSDNKKLIPSKQIGVRKDRKKLRVELFGHVGGSILRSKSFDLGDLEDPLVLMRKGLLIGLKTMS